MAVGHMVTTWHHTTLAVWEDRHFPVSRGAISHRISESSCYIIYRSVGACQKHQTEWSQQPNPLHHAIICHHSVRKFSESMCKLQTCPAAPSSRLKSIFKVLNASFGLLPMVVNRSRKSFWNLAVPSHCLIWENFEQVADCLIIANWANYSLQWREWHVYNCN